MFGFKFKEKPKPEEREQNPVLGEIHDFNVTEKGRIAAKLDNCGAEFVANFFQSNKNNSQEPFSSKEKSTSPEKNIIILKKLDPRSGTFMESDIYNYYRETYLQSIDNSLKKRGIPKEKLDLVVDQILKKLAKKPITKFKENLKTTLMNGDIPESEFANFWQWRITNPPNSEPLLVRKNDEDHIQYDDFASKEALEKFISQNNTPEQAESDVKIFTSADLDRLVDELGGFPRQSTEEK